jgi:beta-lactamase class A
MSTASVGKLLLLVDVARRCEDSAAFDEKLLGRNGIEPVGDSGVLQHLSVERLSISDLAVLVASVSDNLATNVLLREVGLSSVDDLGRRLGLRATALLDRVRDERRPEDAPTLSYGSSEELSQLMVGLAGGTLVSGGVSARLREWLSTGVDLSLVASAFGLDPLAHGPADGDVTVLNKTGTDHGIRADVGAVIGPTGRLAYSVVANWDEAGRGPLDLVIEGMREVGAALRRQVTV